MTFQARENLNALKMERDQTRIAINKLRIESGLLAEPTLLRDMESSLKELADIKTELEQLKTDNKVKAQHIRNIRKNIEMTSEELTKTRNTKLTIERKRLKPRIIRGRPSIFKPTLPADAYDHLRDRKISKVLPARSLFRL